MPDEISGSENIPESAIEPVAVIAPASDILAGGARSPATAPAEDILSILQELRTAFDDKIKYDASRERLIERLHAEVQEYKEDLFLKILKSMALDLVTLHDTLGKWTATDGAASVSLADIQGDVEDVLDRNGFESFVVAEETFDPRRQRALRKVPTGDAALDKRIAERLRKGFSYQGKVIRPECVAVYVFQLTVSV